MPNIVTISDFSGSVQLQRDNQTEAKFNLIRDEFTNEYIYKLLGVVLGNLFLADLDANGVPQTARFESLYDPFQEDWNNEIKQSRGIKFFVKNIIWYYYSRQNNVVITTAGNRTKKGENSDPSLDGMYLAKNFNASINTGKAIQWYISQNFATYPEYNGQKLDYLIGL
jgi:hypothetical protein